MTVRDYSPLHSRRRCLESSFSKRRLHSCTTIGHQPSPGERAADGSARKSTNGRFAGPSSLLRLSALPIWNEAVRTRAETALKVQTLGRVEPDPILAEAIALQGYEEGRHARILRLPTNQYGIPVDPFDEPRPPRSPAGGATATWTPTNSTARPERSRPARARRGRPAPTHRRPARRRSSPTCPAPADRSSIGSISCLPKGSPAAAAAATTARRPPVTRAQMAVFLLKAEHGSSYVPPACAGIFAGRSLPVAVRRLDRAARRRRNHGRLRRRGLLSVQPEHRDQMAVFLVKAFGLQLYGP